MKRLYLFALLLLASLFFMSGVFSQVVIQADPSDETPDATNTAPTSPISEELSSRKVTYAKEDREKILVLLKKIYPEKSFSALNHILAKHMDEGAIELSAQENKELADVMSKEPDQSLVDKIQEFALGGSDTNGLFTGIEQVRKAFAENPLSLVPKDQVKETLLKQWEGKILGDIFKNNPKILEFFSSLVIDKTAVPKLLDIFQKKNELKYFTVLVVIAQLMCLLAFFTLFKESSLLGRLLKRAILMMVVNGILVLYFIWRFYPEVSPTLSIFHQSFMS